MATSQPACDLLLIGGSVVTVDDDRRVIEPGAVAIDGERITAVGPAEDFAGWTSARRIDCSGKAVIPGFVDCHSHLFQTLARGLGDGLALWPWLNEFMWPYAGTIAPNEARIARSRWVPHRPRGPARRASSTTTTRRTISRRRCRSPPRIDEVGLRGAVARGSSGRRPRWPRRMGLTSSLFTRSAEEELDITAGCLEQRGPPAGWSCGRRR